MKSAQNLKYFWRTSRNYFVLALFSGLFMQLATFLNESAG
jgi:hypothetical protein